MPHRISLQRSDITTLAVDAIVTASNPALVSGGTVSAAGHRAAGPDLAEACRQYPGAKPGDAVITPGFQLPAKYVIHAVGPSWWPGKVPEADTLVRVYRRSFALVAKHGIRTVAFSAISCGFYAYPLPEASAIAIRETVSALKNGLDVEQVIFALFAENVHAAFTSALAKTRNE
ncbi:MAG: O-acetyl-ADP-ribose deacetylase [Acidobacteriota bacterium]|jgi:O-acetyl-ADP-ribose deacetylase (regulator of RNase III)|nr:O-acetyl-ADP-ribose deacetylase [Acidobacteriota bacterium]